MNAGTRSYGKAPLRVAGRLLLKSMVREKNFTVFSNDCYGAEIYRQLRLEYNTPFVGLMLMAPCYIKLLERPQHYLAQPVRRLQSSRYESMEDFRAAHRNYPLGTIEDIEIHFMHYPTLEAALEKWNRRKARINWNRLKLKFSMDKDFATAEHLKTFEALPHRDKVSFSRSDFAWAASNVVVPGYDFDATVTFRRSLSVFNLCGWLNGGGVHFETVFQRILGQTLYQCLKN